MPDLTLRVSNFRALRKLEWSPSGVCVLAGSNGSGKSSVLGALKFLRNAALRGVPEAERFAEAGSAFRNLHAPKEADVEFEIEHDGWRWRLAIPVVGQGVHAYNGEHLWRGDKLVLEVPRLQAQYTLSVDDLNRGREASAAIHTLNTVNPDEALARFIDSVKAIRVYDKLGQDKRDDQPLEVNDHSFLYPWGSNLDVVLKNWKGAARRYDRQFEWVMKWIKKAFPDLIEDLEFTPEARFYPPNAPHADASLPLSVAAAGLMTGLLQLTAVAGAKEGSTIAFDEFENQLHPHAIRVLIAAMREMADKKHLNVILTTHSPVVLNQFRDDPEQVFVLGHRDPALPTPARMTDLHTEEWLAQAKLGSLYERLAFGAPEFPGGEK